MGAALEGTRGRPGSGRQQSLSMMTGSLRGMILGLLGRELVKPRARRYRPAQPHRHYRLRSSVCGSCRPRRSREGTGMRGYLTPCSGRLWRDAESSMPLSR